MSDVYDVYGCQFNEGGYTDFSTEKLVSVLDDDIVYVDQNSAGKLLVNTPAVEVRILNFRSGQQTPYETAVYDLSLFVMEGAGNLALGYEDTELTKSSVVVVPKGMLWGIKNSGYGDMTIIQNINKN